MKVGEGIHWYDKNGKPLYDYEEIEKLLNDVEYKRVAVTTLSDGTWISTVWLGLDYSWSEGNPIIFETMVFSEKKDKDGFTEDLEMQRYSTLEQAKAGHKAMVKKWREVIK